MASKFFNISRGVESPNKGHSGIATVLCTEVALISEGPLSETLYPLDYEGELKWGTGRETDMTNITSLAVHAHAG